MTQYLHRTNRVKFGATSPYLISSLRVLFLLLPQLALSLLLAIVNPELMPYTTTISSQYPISKNLNTQPVDESKSTLAPAQPERLQEEAAPSPWMPFTILANLKEVRGYEYDRQRMKKTAEFAKMKARKEQGWMNIFRAAYKASGGGTLPAQKFQVREEDLDLSEGATDSRGDLRNQGIRQGFHMEVQLADIITSKTARSRKGKDGDFEVIPHIRSVIVLDDTTGCDIAIDEPWEYIHKEGEEEGTRYPSYAEVASVAK